VVPGAIHATVTSSSAAPLIQAVAVDASVATPLKRCRETETHFDGSPSKYPVITSNLSQHTPALD
jgi:hypothetical protein